MYFLPKNNQNPLPLITFEKCFVMHIFVYMVHVHVGLEI